MTGLCPTASTDAAALREGHIGKSVGFWDAHRLSLERSKRQLVRLLERFAGTSHAGPQQQLLSRTLSEKESGITLQACYTPSPNCLSNPTVLSSHLPGGK